MDCLYNCAVADSGIDWPAWVQAVGSVVAILVAIAVPLLIRRADKLRERDERRIRTKGFALEVLPWIEELQSSLIWTRQQVRKPEAYLQYDEIAEQLQVPKDLQLVVRHLHELDEVASDVQDSIAHTRTVKWLLDAHYGYLRDGGVYFTPDGREIELSEPQDFNPVLDAAISKIQSAIYRLNLLFK